MERRKFSREFKSEAVGLIRERGVSVAQASRDLGVHVNMLRKWVRELVADPTQAFPGHGQMKPEHLEIDRLRREVVKLKAERDIPAILNPHRRLADFQIAIIFCSSGGGFEAMRVCRRTVQSGKIT